MNGLVGEIKGIAWNGYVCRYLIKFRLAADGRYAIGILGEDPLDTVVSLLEDWSKPVFSPMLVDGIEYDPELRAAVEARAATPTRRETWGGIKGDWREQG